VLIVPRRLIQRSSLTGQSEPWRDFIRTNVSNIADLSSGLSEEAAFIGLKTTNRFPKKQAGILIVPTNVHSSIQA
jgi:hypothetical protein